MSTSLGADSLIAITRPVSRGGSLDAKVSTSIIMVPPGVGCAVFGGGSGSVPARSNSIVIPSTCRGAASTTCVPVGPDLVVVGGCIGRITAIMMAAAAAIAAPVHQTRRIVRDRRSGSRSMMRMPSFEKSTLGMGGTAALAQSFTSRNSSSTRRASSSSAISASSCVRRGSLRSPSRYWLISNCFSSFIMTASPALRAGALPFGARLNVDNQRPASFFLLSTLNSQL